ncbi:hypothetical protein JTB14_009352 [Gonioctena quinquepunctata]|nr:hypothetical protein JTB14_009352 [Gonioctena quinquepunctata]
MILLNNKVQRKIFRLAACGLMTYNIIFISYIIFQAPSIDRIIKLLPGQCFTSEMQVCFIQVLYRTYMLPMMIEETQILVGHIERCDKKMKDRLEKESRKIIFMRRIVLLMVASECLSTVPFLGGDEEFFVGTLILKHPALQVVFLIAISYCCFAGISTFFIQIFLCSHIRFQNPHLEEILLVDNRDYQLRVSEELRDFWNHYMDIKRYSKALNKISDFILVASALHGVFILGSILVYFLNEKAINNYFMFSAAVVTFCMMFIILESGEQIQSEGDKLYALVQTCNWHRWNQENRKFLQMFLLLVKKPLDISAYGIIQQDRILSMRIMKGLYSVFTFYGCMNK